MVIVKKWPFLAISPYAIFGYFNLFNLKLFSFIIYKKKFYFIFGYVNYFILGNLQLL
jgi:hypothetical protein